MEKVERQEHPIMDNVSQTTEQGSQNLTDEQDTELEGFLNLETFESTTDLENKDSLYHQKLLETLNRRILRWTSLRHESEVNLYTSVIMECKFKKATILKSMAQFTSPQSPISPKPDGSIISSTNEQESKSDTSQLKSVILDANLPTKKSNKESLEKKKSVGTYVTTTIKSKQS